MMLRKNINRKYILCIIYILILEKDESKLTI